MQQCMWIFGGHTHMHWQETTGLHPLVSSQSI